LTTSGEIALAVLPPADGMPGACAKVAHVAAMSSAAAQSVLGMRLPPASGRRMQKSAAFDLVPGCAALLEGASPRLIAGRKACRRAC
jgi:hypothetical protein